MSLKKPETSEEFMSTLTKHVCDNCKRETTDWYLEIGWIQIRGQGISIAKGRKPDRTGDTHYIRLSETGTLDFCNIACFVEYLHRVQKPKAEKCSECGAEKTS